jgi:glutamyl-tRNA(Gln) amidotransferase subunit E
MYPETDIPPVAISKERENRLLAALPERPAELEGRIEREHRLSPEVTRQIVYGGLVDRFETLTRGGHSPILVARLLTQDLPSVVDALSGSTFEPVTGVLEEILRACETGRIAKEGIPAVLEALARGAPTVGEAIARTGLEGLSAEGLRQLVERVVRAQAATIRARGKEAFSPLMGDVMKEVRGRRDGREVAEELRRAIDRELQGSAG